MSSANPASTTSVGRPMRTGEMSFRTRKRIAVALRLLIAAIAVFFALFPAAWILSAAFNPGGTLTSQTFIPRGVDSIDELLTNFRSLLTNPQTPFLRWVINSITVSGISAVLSVLLTALSAYSFSRFRFRGRRSLLMSILLVQVFPNLLSIVTLYLLLQQIGRYIPFLGLDTLGGLILIYVGGAMGGNVWLMKGFFDSIPRDIDESAQVDGATHWQAFWMLIIPLVRPILAVVAILSFVGTYSDFILARIMLVDKNNYTVIVGLYNFITQNYNQEWGFFAAGAIMGAGPIIVLYLLLQDQIVGGLTQGAVKG